MLKKPLSQSKVDGKGLVVDEEAPNEYVMAEARAQAEGGGLWHFLRVYGKDIDTAVQNLRTEVSRRKMVLDGTSTTFTKCTKGERVESHNDAIAVAKEWARTEDGRFGKV